MDATGLNCTQSMVRSEDTRPGRQFSCRNPDLSIRAVFPANLSHVGDRRPGLAACAAGEEGHANGKGQTRSNPKGWGEQYEQKAQEIERCG